DANLIKVTQPIKEEEQSAPSPIEEEQLGEIKSVLRPFNEESIIEYFLLSFQGPDLIDEPMMEEDHIVSKAPSRDQATEEPSVLPPTSSPSSSN
ncbi:hypothetical protein KI387_041301, partial [Taxus chinensis]